MPKMDLHKRKNPNEPHVQKFIAYRERKGRPKAKIWNPANRTLSSYRYLELTSDYTDRAKSHQGGAINLSTRTNLDLIAYLLPKPQGEERKMLEREKRRLLENSKIKTKFD
jgi:hypothetical protein